MNPLIRNILAVVIGLIIGAALNSFIVLISESVISLPEGVNPNDAESLKQNIHLFEPKHFLLPFLAHALGTLAGAFVAVKIGLSHHLRLALLIAVFFIIGGIMAVILIPAPIWFCILDLVASYFPMAYLGYKLAIE